MKSAEIRGKFLKFFEEKGHAAVASSPLVPANDPTLLFTNSGMVQFKDVFLGRETRAYKRATTAQRCLRAGGKHNDLENVGYTARHHTSSRCSAISPRRLLQARCDPLRVDLLTEVYKLPPERLWTTVHHEDNEAYDLWTKEIGVPKGRCIRIGDKPGARSIRATTSGRWRYRTMRPLQRDFLRPWTRHLRQPAGIERGRRRPLRRDLESRLHAVQPRRIREAPSAAQAFGRHRNGPGAHRGGASGRSHPTTRSTCFGT